MRRLRLNICFLGRLGLVLLGISAWIGLAATARGATPPPNDSFANAIVIAGFWGTTNADTTAATAEPGEPAHAGAPAAHSIWYKLIVIQDGTMTVHTYGSAIDTRLAVYSVPANANPAVNGVLFPVAANDDMSLSQFFGPSVSRGPSIVTFPVKNGDVYYVAVDSNRGGGQVQLSWGYNFGGLFYFVKPQFQAPKFDMIGYPQDPSGRIEFAVGRLFGYAGKVLVDVVTTNYTGPNTPAVDGVDYLGGRQTLSFTNFETMQTFSVPIFQAPPPPPDTNGIFGSNPNVYFNVQIVGVRFDPQENTNLLEPAVILPGYDTSVGREVDPDIARGTGDGSPAVPFAATNIINFAQTHHITRSSERGDNPGVLVASPGYAQVWFTRNGFGNPADSPTIYWAINSRNVVGDLQNNTFPLSPESDYATPDPPTINPPSLGPADFLMPCIPGPSPYGNGVSVEARGSVGSVAWGNGDFLPKLVLVPLNDDTLPEFNEDFVVDILFGPPPYEPQNCLVGEINRLTVTIGFDGNDQPAGALEGDYNHHQQPPNNTHPGANDDIFALVVQPDQSVVIGGAFVEYNAFLRNGIARVNFDGTIDESFNPGTGADGLVTSLALQQDGKILMGGDFRSVNGVNRYRVARLNIQGSVDATFNPGVGADGTVWSLALSTNGSIVIGGQFDSFNNYPRSRVARLDTLGNVDLTFDTSNLRLDGTVWAVAPQSDGRVVIGGDFTTVGGVPRSRVARLNADGSLDTSFDPLLGANSTVRTLLVQADGHILVGGSFTQFHTAAHHGLTRLLSSGVVDPSFRPGTGANDTVFSVFYAPAEFRIYVGGQFTSFNGTRRVAVARLFLDGTVDTSFLDTAYNQYAGLITPLFNPDLYKHKAVYALGQQDFTIGSGTNAVTYADLAIGGSFDLVGGGGGSRRALDFRYNLTLLRGGSTPGPGNITFAYPNGSGLNNANKDQLFLDMTLIRTNGTLGTIATRFSPDPLPVGPGAAIYGQDYTYNPITYGLPWYGTTWGPRQSSRMVSDGIWWRNYPDPLDVFGNGGYPSFIHAEVNIINNTTASGNRAYNLNLSIPWQANSFFLGGANIPLGLALGPETTTSSLIIDNRSPPGTFSFITTNYTASEAGGCVSIMVSRSNGSSDTVTLQYLTQDLPGTPPPGIGFARSNVNYFATSGQLIFYPGITNQSFNVCLRDDGHVDPDLALLLVITNITAGHPMNGTALGGVTNAWLTIIDSDFPQGRLNFSAASFVTNETAGNAIITVTRTGGSQGAMTVLCSTTNTVAGPGNTPAVAGVNYTPVTNVLLVWTNGDSAPKSFMVPVLHDNQITPNLTVGLRLSTPVLNGVTNNMALGALSNAVLTILNVDHLGTLSFSSPTYVQNENGGFAIIPVVRQGGSVGTLSANFNASTGLNASAGVEFVATNGSLTFGPGEVSKVFTVPLIDKYDSDVSYRAVVLVLTNPVPSGVLGSPSTALLSIVGDGFNVPPGESDPTFDAVFNGAVNAVGLQPNGAIVAGGAFTVANSVTRNRLARLNSDGSLDYGFASSPGQANDTIRALALQSDGRILIGGDFITYDGSSRNHFARVNLDGTLDWQFDPGSGLDHSAFAVVETFTDTNQTVRKILVGGSFTLANGAPRHYLAQFNNDGSVDLGFNAANGANGLDGSVWAIAVQGDHKIIIGGDFLSINGVARNHIARLNADGSLDYSFNNPGTGAGDSVRALTIQLDGRILVGGLFTNFNGTVQNHIVRLNADGSPDPTFNGGVGGDGAVYAIALQPDNRILLGGEFTRWGGVTRNHLTRLNPDGSVDTTINFGAGCDNFVASLVVQTNDSILLGGGFTTYDNASAPYLTRIFGRSVAGSGTFEFTSATFGAYETATNAVITLRRRGGTSATTSEPNVYVTVATSDGYPPNGAINGTNYLGGLFTNAFPPGETFGTVLIPMLHDFQVTPDLTVNLQITDIEPLGLDGLGNQPIATLFITNVDSVVRFSAATYSIAKNAQEGRATIPIYRLGSTVGSSQVEFMTTANGTAQPFGRYVPVVTNILFSPGDTVQNAFIPLINDTQVLGDQTVTMVLANPTNTLLSTPAAATLTIIETSTATGTLSFDAPSYVVSEQGTNVYLNVLRKSGVTGIVTVDYFTKDGTALAGVKYVATNGTLVFADGETSKTISVPIINDTNVTGNALFSVVLTNVTGGATLIGPTTVPVTIVDENVGISFASPIYVVSETAGTVSLSVLRQNGSNHLTTVHYSTTNLTARAGVNYVGITNGTLTFNPGESVKGIVVQILHDPRITGNLSFAVNLFNPSAPAELFKYSSAVVNILDADTGLGFGTTDRLVITNADLSTVTNASYSVLKSGTNVLITVLRSNANTGTVSVNYATATNANDNAVAGVDYGPASGLLTFSNNVGLQSFLVPIFNNRQIEGNRTFSVNLFNPTGGAQLIPPTTATVTIIDDVAGISFSSPNYRVNENGGSATITVLRSNYVNSIVSVDYATANTPQAGINYSNVSGTLTFNPGETVKTFSVPVLDDGVLNGDVAVPLSLGNVVGNAVFMNPSAATLTIVETDGSLVVSAGSALISESGPVNGVIDPGETVTLLFALRDSTGTNTVNLVATLLATNGVTRPSAPQNYGALVVHGPSVSRPFSFTASGTNGQTIGATFQLQDGSVNLGLALFNFTLGQTASRFANRSAIVINDSPSYGTPGIATPYPAVINVNGLAGLVTKATVTLTNLNHTWPSDIDILLVSPTGQNSYLMAKCGSSYTINNVTLTFDDAASNSLPQSSQIVSGAYRPTSYAVATPPFPAASTPPPPYGVGLSAFNGNNPNGNWKLYVIDDTPGNFGAISNGWVLTLATAGVVPAAADVGLAMTASAATVVATSNLTYTLTLANYGPSAATSIVVTDALPAGMAYVSSSPSVGSVSNSAGLITWTIPSLAKDAVASLALVVQANSTGTITNAAAVTSGTADLNPDDNTALAVVVVSSPTADLAIGLFDAPDPLSLGGYLTYTIMVSNLGPATATGVIAVDTLPPAVNFISASPANSYTAAGGVVTFTNLGNLASGAQINLTVIVQPTAAGTITDTASCRSGVVDPLKANNSASVKTIVQSLSLTVTRADQSLVISWPAGAGNYTLESTTDLMPPAVWTPVTNPPPTVVGGQNTVTIPIGSGSEFFRLHATP